MNKEGKSGFNVGDIGARSSKSVDQAKLLIKRMKSDPKVDMKNNWKLISFMFGANDFCLEICKKPNQDKVIEDMTKDLLTSLRILKKNLPRALINVIYPPNVAIFTRYSSFPPECLLTHFFECPCFFRHSNRKNYMKYSNTIQR